MVTSRIVVHLNLAELVVTEVLSSSQSGRQDGQASDVMRAVRGYHLVTIYLTQCCPTAS